MTPKTHVAAAGLRVPEAPSNSIPFRAPHKPGTPERLAQVEYLLAYIDPECGYRHWTRVLMAIFYESRGSEAGFSVADAWSAQGKSYRGTSEVRAKWRSFSLGHPKPIRLGTLVKLAREGGLRD
jgi:hypothetical protein